MPTEEINKIKAILNSIRLYRSGQLKKMEEIKRLKQQVYNLSGIDYAADKVITSHSNATESLICRINELEAELSEEISRIRDNEAEIISLLKWFPNHQVQIIIKRYWNGENFNQIAKELKYSPKTITRQHRYALSKLSKALCGM